MPRKTSGAPAAPASSMAALADTLTASTPPSASDAPALPAFPAAAVWKVDKTASQTRQDIVQAWVKLLASVPGLNPRDKKSGERVRRAVTRALEDLPGEPYSKETIRPYSLGAMRAFACGIPWTASLHKAKDILCPWETKKEKDAEPAKADAATRQELDAALIQAIQLARKLGLKDAAVALATVATERLTGFKVPTDK